MLVAELRELWLTFPKAWPGMLQEWTVQSPACAAVSAECRGRGSPSLPDAGGLPAHSE